MTRLCYELFFNRDEQLTRKAALPPRLAEFGGVRFLAPVDGDFGGTWMASNEYGISICLLNGANLTGSRGGEKAAARSIGLVVPELMASLSMAAVQTILEAVSCEDFAPFTLAALGPSRPTILFEWDGSRKTVQARDECYFMLRSSSFDSVAVRMSREEEFRGLVDSRGEVDARLLERFHQSHAPARSAYSVCMHRQDAETMSHARIRVTQQKARATPLPPDMLKIPGVG